MELSDKVTVTRAFPALKMFWQVIVFLHRVSQIQFFKKMHTILKKH